MKMLAKMERVSGERGLKQHELEAAAHLAPNRIAKWRSGQGEPTARQALRIARALDVPVEWLIDDEAEGDPPASVPPPSPALPYEDRVILDVVHAMGLDHHAAIRRLAPPGEYVAPPDALSPPRGRSGGRAG